MAPMRAKESPHHLREKSSSAQSSPRSRITYSPASHGSRRTSEDTTDDRELPMLPRKPMPNYLQPTISSARNTCPYADRKPSLPPSAAARRLLLRKRTADAASAQRSPRVNTSCREPKTPRALISPLPKFPRPLSQRALKTPKTDKPAAPSARSRTLKKRRDAEPKEEVVAVADQEQHSPMDKHPVAFGSSPSHRGDLSDDEYEGSGESMAGEEVDGGKQRARRGQPAVVEDDGGELMRRLKFRHEKEVEEERDERTTQEESPKPIEETASKMAGKRRSKVAALAGAFETVMTLPSQAHDQQQEEMVVVQGDADVRTEEAGDVKATAEVLGETMEKGYEGSMDEGAKEESAVAGETDVCLTDQSNTRL